MGAALQHRCWHLGLGWLAMFTLLLNPAVLHTAAALSVVSFFLGKPGRRISCGQAGAVARFWLSLFLWIAYPAAAMVLVWPYLGAPVDVQVAGAILLITSTLMFPNFSDAPTGDR